MTTCPQCTGTASKLGRLGDTTHYKCRSCGWIFSKTPPPELVRATDKASPRRFNDELLTGFGE